ncbi:MAG TPA: type VI secretion system baseplate subunit TssE [Bryobacteraceae bacterium]|nr:type VI secretion system baseplate subunit TssE [Bryobacteraceae bacterium]
MARARGEAPIGLSVLDRLIDEDLRVPEKQLTRSESLRKLRDAVRRDLEWLLNTRHPIIVPPVNSQLNQSLYMYGIPDVTSMSAKNMTDRQRLLQAMQDTIAQFEPRVANPRVTLAPDQDEKIPILRFVIEGLLRVDPSPEQIAFGAVVELANGECKVQSELHAR